jgi:protein associated with RNAse G/E
LAQYVWHPYYIDALAVRYYDADTDGSSVDHYYTHEANFNVTAVTEDDGDVLERYGPSHKKCPIGLDANR